MSLFRKRSVVWAVIALVMVYNAWAGSARYLLTRHYAEQCRVQTNRATVADCGAVGRMAAQLIMREGMIAALREQSRIVLARP